GRADRGAGPPDPLRVGRGAGWLRPRNPPPRQTECDHHSLYWPRRCLSRESIRRSSSPARPRLQQTQGRGFARNPSVLPRESSFGYGPEGSLHGLDRSLQVCSKSRQVKDKSAPREPVRHVRQQEQMNWLEQAERRNKPGGQASSKQLHLLI